MNDTTITLAVVDDHDGMRSALADMMNRMGFFVTIFASDGKDFFQQLDEVREIPKVCLMDLHMPVMDGFSAIAEIRRRNLPIGIVAHSMNNLKVQIVKAMEAGADLFVDKAECTPEDISEALLEAYRRYNGN